MSIVIIIIILIIVIIRAIIVILLVNRLYNCNMSNYSNKSNYSNNYYYINKSNSNCNTIWEKVNWNWVINTQNAQCKMTDS